MAVVNEGQWQEPVITFCPPEQGHLWSPGALERSLSKCRIIDNRHEIAIISLAANAD